MSEQKKTYISLFSSAGVGCYGFKLEGFECIATNELIERRLNVQKANIRRAISAGTSLQMRQKSFFMQKLIVGNVMNK